MSRRAGLRKRCAYFDGALMEDGRPNGDACPPPTDPMDPFCGGSCGACPPHPRPARVLGGEWHGSRTGISETRGDEETGSWKSK